MSTGAEMLVIAGVSVKFKLTVSTVFEKFLLLFRGEKPTSPGEVGDSFCRPSVLIEIPVYYFSLKSHSAFLEMLMVSL